MSDSLRPHGPQPAWPPCPSPTPGVYSDSCSLSPCCHPNILSSVVPFSSHLQPFPALRVFSSEKFFVSGGQSIEASASASVLPMNIQDWFPSGLIGLISSSQSKRLSKVFSTITIQKHQFFSAQTSLWSITHIHTTTRKTIALTIQTLISKVVSLFFLIHCLALP